MGAFKGRYATTVALMCCMAAATIGVAQNTPGVFYATVAEDLGVMTGTYSFFGTAQLVAIALSSLVVPQLLAFFGIKWMVMLSTVGMTLATVVLAFADSLPVIYLCGALRGFSASVAAVIPITIIINNWFEKANGTATSIALSFSGLAGAAFSPILTWFITNYDWRIAYLVQASLLCAFMLPPLFVPLSVKPQDEGLLPFGASPEQRTADTLADEAGSTNTKALFGTLAFSSMAGFVFMHCLITGLAQHISGYAVSIGFSAGFGALLLSLSMVGNISSKLLIGILTDKLGALRSSIVMIAINIAALVLIYLGATSATGWMMATGAVLYGSVYATAAVGIALLTRLFFGDKNYARVYPKFAFISSFGCALAIPIVGYVYDFTGAYDYAVIACLIINIIDLVLLRMASRASRTLQ